MKFDRKTRLFYNSCAKKLYDFDLNPMTLILKLDLSIVKMHQHTKNEVSMSRGSKVIA